LRQLSDLEQAYTALFSDSAHAVMVLRDLATQTGFMASLPVGTDPDVLTDHNARRAVFGRIYEILVLTASGRRAIAEAFTPAQPEE
jgi:hypothetical protein